MASLRHIAAIRARLLQSTSLVPLLAVTSDGVPAVYLSHIYGVNEAVFPCVTLSQRSGNMGVWVPRIIDPAYILIDSFSKFNNQQPSDMDEFIEVMLHKQEQQLNLLNMNADFGEIRKTNWATSMWDEQTRSWRVTSQYLIRAAVT